MPEWLEKLVTTGSPAMIFAVMWFLERMERKQDVRDFKAQSQQIIILMTEIKAGLMGKKGNGA